MKKQFMKIFVPLIVVLIVASLVGVFPATAADQTSDEYTNFMENVLSVDVSKYKIELKSNFTVDSLPSTVNRTINNLRYELTSGQSRVDIYFSVEKGVIGSCGVSPLSGEVLTTLQYSSQLDAVKAFLERYQTYTKIDSNSLIAMLDNVDTTKNSTITTENIKLEIENRYIWEADETAFTWWQIIDGAEYDLVSFVFDKNGLLISMGESRGIFTIVDSSINVSDEQAIDIALENLQFYSYELPDGSVVKDFKVSRDGVIATMVTFTGDYELRPYWQVEMFLDETAPGNVFGITAFIWANTGEIISYSNMATDGTNSSDDPTTETTPSSTDATFGESNLVSDMLVPLGIAAAIIAAIAVSTVVAVKKRKQQPL